MWEQFLSSVAEYQIALAFGVVGATAAIYFISLPAPGQKPKRRKPSRKLHQISPTRTLVDDRFFWASSEEEPETKA